MIPLYIWTNSSSSTRTHALIFVLATWTGFVLRHNTHAINLSCDLVVKFHPTLDGVGVYANRDYLPGEVIQRVSSANYTDRSDDKAAMKTHHNLYNYVFEANTDGNNHNNVSVFLFGYGSLFNHRPEKWANVDILHSNSIIEHTQKQGKYTMDYTAVANRYIEKGDELSIDYGEDWFHDHRIEYIDMPGRILAPNREVTTKKLKLPGCPTRNTEIIKGRVYSTQYIFANEIIEVSKALQYVQYFIQDEPIFHHLWYEEFDNLGSVILTGNGALYRPAHSEYSDSHSDIAAAVLDGSTGGQIEPPPPQQHNVEVSWLNFDVDKAPFAWEDLRTKGGGYVAFLAARDIAVGEELTVPLKVDPVTGQRHVFNDRLPTRETYRNRYSDNHNTNDIIWERTTEL